MRALSKQHQNETIKNLSEKFSTKDVQYHGYNRFVVRVKYQVELADGSIIMLYKDHLFDENSNQIPLKNEYNSIFIFTAGVAVVCIRENIRIVKDRFTQDRRDGLIDTNGKELLPCIYDSIRIHLYGFIEITKDGQKKSTTANVITSGNFDWGSAND